MNGQLKSELKEVYAELIRYLDNGGSKAERDVILDKLCGACEKLKMENSKTKTQETSPSIVVTEKCEEKDETKLGLQDMIAQYYELKETLTEVIGIYKKLQYSNSHEYSMELNAREKMFTVADARRMDEIIKKVGLD